MLEIMNKDDQVRDIEGELRESLRYFELVDEVGRIDCWSEQNFEPRWNPEVDLKGNY